MEVWKLDKTPPILKFGNMIVMLALIIGLSIIVSVRVTLSNQLVITEVKFTDTQLIKAFAISDNLYMNPNVVAKLQVIRNNHNIQIHPNTVVWKDNQLNLQLISPICSKEDTLLLEQQVTILDLIMN